MSYAASLPESTPLCPAGLLQFGTRATIDQSLNRLAKSGRLFRICQGVYMQPVKTRFGPCAPRIDQAINKLSKLWGETIVPCGGSAANRLGLTTQNPLRGVYLTAGPNRLLDFDGVLVELRHAPRWQLQSPYRKTGDLIRALSWLGPEEVDESLDVIWSSLSDQELQELYDTRAILPSWIANPISARMIDN